MVLTWKNWVNFENKTSSEIILDLNIKRGFIRKSILFVLIRRTEESGKK